MNRKYIFITKYDDNLAAIEGLKVSTDFDENLKPEPDSTGYYTLFETENKKRKSAYILSINRGGPDNEDVWNVDKIKELYKKLSAHFHGEKETFVLAIHWGEKEEERDGRDECDKITEKLDKTIRKNIILTHYSGKYDDIIGQVNTDGSGLDKVIEMIANRINKDSYIASAQIFYGLKEDLLRSLFPLTWGQTLKNDQIKFIEKTIKKKLKSKEKKLKSKNAEIGDNLLQPISEKLSELFKSLEEPQAFDSEKCTKALQDIRANLNTLIDGQLEKADKKAIYEQR